jgi:hypothetical protein
MNELQAVQAFLSAAMQADNQLALANVVAWLDPMYLTGTIDDNLSYADYGEENDLPITLSVCRHCFPTVYAQAVQLIWQGTDEGSLGHMLCEGMNAKLVGKLDHIEQVKYGVPIEAMGLCVDDPEFYDAYPDLGAIVADFCLRSEERLDTELARRAARLLIDSLEASGSKTLAEVGQLLTWLFSLSGNTLVDMTADEIWESGMELPDWVPDDIAFVNAMTSEAIEIVQQASDGEKTLERDPELRTALRENIQLIYKTFEKESKRRKPHDGSLSTRHLKWPERP